MGIIEKVVAFTLVAVSSASVAFVVYRKNRAAKRKLPCAPEWKQIGTVGEISLYPLRSAAALVVEEAKCTEYGLQLNGVRDRFMVLQNQHGQLIYSGTFPAMRSITTEINHSDIIVIRAPGKKPLTLNVNSVRKGKPTIAKKCKGFAMQLIECDVEHHKWFSDVLLQRTDGLKLYICMTPKLMSNIFGEDKSEFNPIMVINNKSIDDLNKRLSNSEIVHHLQFRGNLLLNCNDDTEAYDEDNWVWLKIGDNNENVCILSYRAPCLRCISPNINIHTCKRSRNFEPLKTLRSYRLIHNSREPTMGAYYNVYQQGKIHINDPVYAIVSTNN
ncbi:mitochondrial amidoxime reducing component 2-like [Musca autumnalis]|uniref:mitochondrial amidoxime reducing component 2-like n=1 Tax=Musca autumnalis TaxID=221902 RepID=UPI003CFB0C43